MKERCEKNRGFKVTFFLLNRQMLAKEHMAHHSPKIGTSAVVFACRMVML